MPRILVLHEHSVYRTGLRIILGINIPGAEVSEAGSLIRRLIPNSRRRHRRGDHRRGSLRERAGKEPSGICPDIRLYDFRVLAKTLEDTEFAIIAALQYIRYINERHSFITIHGANLSLSIPHNVRNFACGRTPICNECERLVESGVVVVAAAGNRGYQSFETKEGLFESYTAFSITDPGKCRRRHHGRRDAPLLAAHLRRELLLEPWSHRRWSAQAGPRRAGRAHPVDGSQTTVGAGVRDEHGGARM